MYLLGALAAWMPPQSAEMRDRQQSVASDIASVVEDPSEPPLFGDKGIEMNGLLLASLAVMEGGLAKYVDSGLCNDVKWRATHKPMLRNGDCDGGKAYSLWQIHPGAGLVLVASGGYASLPYAGPSLGVEVRAKDLTSDRAVAARTALHILRQSFSEKRGMCGYTGESGECPKGKVRLQKAASYYKEHAYRPES
jgi:hypothetical protein